MVPPAEQVERPVVHRLQAELDDQEGPPGQLFKQVQDVLAHAIGARADGQSDDARLGERFEVCLPQPIERTVGVRGRLEVGDELSRPMPVAEPGNSGSDLGGDCGKPQPPAGAEALRVAKYTSASG